MRFSSFRWLLLLILFCAGTFVQAVTPSRTQSTSSLELASGSVLVVDQQNNNVLYASNPDVVLPIASLTKLMTAMVVLDAQQPLDEILPIEIQHTQELRGVFSRVKVGSRVSRQQMLLMTLMSSENRAAASLAHHYPGGYAAFIRAMNAKAQALGMHHTRYVEPTGLSTENVSTASDLTRQLAATHHYPLLSELSTRDDQTVAFQHPNYTLGFRNTNPLVRNANWTIALTKTGFTSQAGHCLVMRTRIGQRPVTIVLLDAFGKYTHFADANRIRSWLETGKAPPVPEAALSYKKQKAL